MVIFADGITVTDIEHKCLLHLVADPEAWVLSTIAEKSRLRRDALIKEWRPRLYADPAVTELPASAEQLCELIMARSDYKTRVQQDATLTPAVLPARDNIARYEATERSGSTVTLFEDGINLADMNTQCILAYVQDLDDWVLGALLGQINRGRKKMLTQYQPIILDDPSVTTMPATEDGLVAMILARADYQRLGA
jgi:hypothetical protein